MNPSASRPAASVPPEVWMPTATPAAAAAARMRVSAAAKTSATAGCS
ncbi:hypothetical protein [Dactylosporangium matsuzakiense]|nr:hypothetical protein [Dactylosporangium matsuzakiense]UWZ48656.1 hypothetical protein Dmats_20965 [Dactylosporangium matsuzakiense]